MRVQSPWTTPYSSHVYIEKTGSFQTCRCLWKHFYGHTCGGYTCPHTLLYFWSGASFHILGPLVLIRCSNFSLRYFRHCVLPTLCHHFVFVSFLLGDDTSPVYSQFHELEHRLWLNPYHPTSMLDFTNAVKSLSGGFAVLIRSHTKA